MTQSTLDALPTGAQARIVGFGCIDADFHMQLMNMGLIPGTRVSVLRSAPLGDPLEIALRGFRLRLRRREAACVEVELL